MSYQGDIENYRQQQLNSTQAMREAEARRLQQQTDQQVKMLQGQQPQLENRFTDQAQQAYIQKKQSEKQLPQQMAAQGYNGGLSESSRIALDSRYGNNYNGLQRDYNSNVDTLNRSIDNTRFQGTDALSASSNRYAGMMNDINSSYNQMLVQAQSDRAGRDLQLQMQQNQFAQSQMQAQQERERQQAEYDYKAREAEADRAYQRELQQAKLAQQQKSVTVSTKTASSGGTGSSKGANSSSSNAKVAATKPLTGANTENIYNSMQGWIKNDPTMYMNTTSESAYNRSFDYLKNEINKGRCTPKQAESIMYRLGYR